MLLRNTIDHEERQHHNHKADTNAAVEKQNRRRPAGPGAVTCGARVTSLSAGSAWSDSLASLGHFHMVAQRRGAGSQGGRGSFSRT